MSANPQGSEALRRLVEKVVDGLKDAPVDETNWNETMNQLLLAAQNDPDLIARIHLAALGMIPPHEALGGSVHILAMLLGETLTYTQRRLAIVTSERDALVERAQAAETMLAELTTHPLPVKW